MWSGVGSVTWNSHTWLGVGSLLAVSSAEDSTSIEAKGLTVTVNGIPATAISGGMTDFKLGLPANLYLGMYTNLPSAGGTLIDTPIVAWSGRIDQANFDVSGQEVSIAINCESRLIDMNIAIDRRYTNEDQQMTYPGDLGFQFVDGLQQKALFWGSYPTNSNTI